LEEESGSLNQEFYGSAAFEFWPALLAMASG
jgi:hypothetical protein